MDYLHTLTASKKDTKTEGKFEPATFLYYSQRYRSLRHDGHQLIFWSITFE